MPITTKILSGKKTNLYRIVNETKNKVYIGLSVDTKKRMYNHKTLLNTNKHHNGDMQEDYNDGDKFDFEVILENLDVSEAQDIENEYINKARVSGSGVYNSKKDNGYWIASTASSNHEKEKVRINQQSKRRALVILEKACKHDAKNIVFEKINKQTLKVNYSEDKFSVEDVYDCDKVISFFEYLIEKINLINKIEVL